MNDSILKEQYEMTCPHCDGSVNTKGKCTSCGYMVKKAPAAKRKVMKKVAEKRKKGKK